MQELGIWNVITTYYITSPVWLVLSIVAILYIVICSNKCARKKLLLCVLFSILCIVNELSYRVLTRIFDQASYYRFLWVIPYGMIVAYALMRYILNLVRSERTRRVQSLGIIFVIGLVFTLYVTQGNYIDRLKNDFPANKYLVTDDILQMKTILDQERKMQVCDAEPTIACPKDVMLQYQTVDAGCTVVTSRLIYLQVREYGADIAGLSQTLKDGYLLSTICEDNAQPDVMETKAAILRQKVDYLVVHTNADMEEYMESIDCTLVGTTQSYAIYRYKYPWYSRVTDKTTVASMKEEMGIHEDEISLDLGLKKEYTILAINDMHVEAMDATVEENYKQTVVDRFNGMFVSNTGIPSMDMWNGISSIIDSYNADGIVCIGDMIDYNSETNAELLRMGYEKIKTPYTYLRADHDLGEWYTDGKVSPETAVEVSKGIAPWAEVYVIDYDEFYMVGWNNSTSQLSDEGLKQMKEIFAKAQKEGKSILLSTHVPINSTVDDGLERTSREVDDKGRAKLWGENCLYTPNSTTQESYRWPRNRNEVKPITWRQFDWLMSGLEIEQPKAIKSAGNA